MFYRYKLTHLSQFKNVNNLIYLNRTFKNEIKSLTNSNLKQKFLPFLSQPQTDIKNFWIKPSLETIYLPKSPLSTLHRINLTDVRLFFAKFSPLSQRKNNDRQSSNNKDKKDDNNNEKNNSYIATFIVWTLITLYVVLTSNNQKDAGFQISWNDFINEMLSKGEVKSVVVKPEQEMIIIKLHRDAIYKGKPTLSDLYILKMGDTDRFEEKLREEEKKLGVKSDDALPVVYDRSISLLPKILFLCGILTIFWFLRSVRFQMPSPQDLFSRERKAKFTRVDLNNKGGITFKEVAGLHEAKVEVMEFVDYLKRPEIYKELGVKIPKGALLLGPPGCGKTLLAKALATEAKVPFLAMAGSEFVEMLGGLGAARVRDLFKEARNKSPCILYIDEVDAIGRSRSSNISSGGGSEEESHTLNQLLVEMDGIVGANKQVVVLASTNRPQVLDQALLRPGRFDRHILIDLPSLAERTEIFTIYLRRLKLDNDPSKYAPILANMSPGMSGADIANICNEAALHAARVGGTNVKLEDFDYAVERVVAGVAKKSRVLSSEEKRVVAYHEAGHALVGWLLKSTDRLLKVSIIPRTTQALGYAQYIPKDTKLFDSHDLFEQMCLILGGRVSESLTFNRVTSGAQDDLQKVTKLAYDQVKLYGFSEKVGLMSFDQQADHHNKPYSKSTAALIDAESNQLVAKAYKFTEKLLTENKEKLKMIAEALIENETLDYKQMEELIGPPPNKAPP